MNRRDFCQDWTFWKANGEQQPVTLPHDAMLHETRSADQPSGSAGGFFPGGRYHYSKTFFVPSEWKDESALLFFEGVYQKATVLLNGNEIGGCAYGYTAFSVPVTGWKVGEENHIEVIVDNSLTPNSRWYSGSGIYRPVSLWHGKARHINFQGVKITTLNYSPARILVETSHTGGEIEVAIMDHNQKIATGSGDRVEIAIPNAKLWSDDNPNLYQCVVRLKSGGEIVEQVSEVFGIRQIDYGPKGLYINGRETLLRGGCIHHDNGILGAKSFAKSEWRRVRILKESGYNAIRSSHNPCSIEMLKACDFYGLYVIDETWDMWFGHKNRYDYASAFRLNYRTDIKSMVAKDYNHPSVLAYSIGNEVAEPATPEGLRLEKEMVDYFHELDAGRPVTGGFNIMVMGMAGSGHAIYDEEGGESDPASKPVPKVMNNSLMFNIVASLIGTNMNQKANNKKFDRLSSKAMDGLDIAGYNYASGRYPKEGRCHPYRLIYGSETFKPDIVKNWRMVVKYPYLIGDFMWTAWDYLGEVGSGAWGYSSDARGFQKPFPWLLADMGVFDILGNACAELYLAQAAWGLLKGPKIAVRPVNHPGITPVRSAWRATNARPSWSWKNCEDNKAVVEVYSNADAVSLFCNGKSVGRKKIRDCKAVFRIKYQPGTLEAVAFNARGIEIGRDKLESARGPGKIAILPEEAEAEVGDLLYVSIQLQGENGILESNDDRLLSVHIEGGELLGFGSANPRTVESYLTGSFKTYFGLAQAVVRTLPGKVIRIQVRDGSKSYEATVPVRQKSIV